MQALAGPVAAAAALLVAAGAPKVARPGNAVGALRSIKLPVPAWLVRTLGAAETALGLATLVVGGRLLVALVAASYAGFTAFVAVALASGGAVASCGCVGRDDTPPTVAHLAVTALLAALCSVAAAGSPGGLPSMLRADPGAATVLVGFAAVIGWLVWLALAELPKLTPPWRSLAR